MTLIRVIDFETTGLAPPEAAVCEVGWCDVVFHPEINQDPETHHWSVGAPHSVLVDPGRPIPPEAMAVHHITDADVAGAATFTEACLALAGDAPTAMAAHNARFEQQFYTGASSWICSYKVALRIAPQAPSHSNQVLRYWSKLACNPDLASPPHRAGPDAYVTACLLARMLSRMSAEEMIRISSEPALLPKFTFGKHAMKPIDEVPSDYLEWMLGQQNMDPDVRHTARHHLAQRSKS